MIGAGYSESAYVVIKRVLNNTLVYSLSNTFTVH